MSQISANIIVETNPISVQVEQSEVGITVEPISLNVYTTGGAGSSPGGNIGELQYKLGNTTLGGVPNTSVANGSLTFSNLSNLKIAGGTNGYVLQTDGTGNLTWTAQTGGSGNGVPGGSNTQIQYNDSGLFGGNVGFTFDETTGNVAIPGNLIVAQTYVGNASGLTDIPGANVTGQVANSLVASTVYTNAQPNITSVGTLSELTVNGTTSIYEAIENVALIGAQTGTYNFDLLDGSIQYSTANATANITLNFRGNSSIGANTIIANGKSITSTYIMTTGTTPYTISSVNIDGGAANIKWVGGITPTALSNSSTAYTYTIVKTSTTPTFVVFASATRYA